MIKQAKAMAGHGRSFGWLTAGIVTFLFGGILALQARPAQSPSPTTAAAPQTAAQKYKNIQVLRSIPADELIPSMQFITAALGVDCNFCHVENQGKLEFDKDDKKEKKTAREMMQMMFAINKNNFDGEREVTCNTCHRGSAHPRLFRQSSPMGPSRKPCTSTIPIPLPCLPVPRSSISTFKPSEERLRSTKFPAASRKATL